MQDPDRDHARIIRTGMRGPARVMTIIMGMVAVVAGFAQRPAPPWVVPAYGPVALEVAAVTGVGPVAVDVPVEVRVEVALAVVGNAPVVAARMVEAVHRAVATVVTAVVRAVVDPRGHHAADWLPYERHSVFKKGPAIAAGPFFVGCTPLAPKPDTCMESFFP